MTTINLWRGGSFLVQALQSNYTPVHIFVSDRWSTGKVKANDMQYCSHYSSTILKHHHVFNSFNGPINSLLIWPSLKTVLSLDSKPLG